MSVMFQSFNTCVWTPSELFVDSRCNSPKEDVCSELRDGVEGNIFTFRRIDFYCPLQSSRM